MNATFEGPVLTGIDGNGTAVLYISYSMYTCKP